MNTYLLDGSFNRVTSISQWVSGEQTIELPANYGLTIDETMVEFFNSSPNITTDNVQYIETPDGNVYKILKFQKDGERYVLSGIHIVPYEMQGHLVQMEWMEEYYHAPADEVIRALFAKKSPDGNAVNINLDIQGKAPLLYTRPNGKGSFDLYSLIDDVVKQSGYEVTYSTHHNDGNLTKTIHFHESLGRQGYKSFAYGDNAFQMIREEDFSGIYTAIVPTGEPTQEVVLKPVYEEVTTEDWPIYEQRTGGGINLKIPPKQKNTTRKIVDWQLEGLMDPSQVTVEYIWEDTVTNSEPTWQGRQVPGSIAYYPKQSQMVERTLKEIKYTPKPDAEYGGRKMLTPDISHIDYDDGVFRTKPGQNYLEHVSGTLLYGGTDTAGRKKPRFFAKYYNIGYYEPLRDEFLLQAAIHELKKLCQPKVMLETDYLNHDLRIALGDELIFQRKLKTHVQDERSRVVRLQNDLAQPIYSKAYIGHRELLPEYRYILSDIDQNKGTSKSLGDRLRNLEENADRVQNTLTPQESADIKISPKDFARFHYMTRGFTRDLHINPPVTMKRKYNSSEYSPGLTGVYEPDAYDKWKEVFEDLPYHEMFRHAGTYHDAETIEGGGAYYFYVPFVGIPKQEFSVVSSSASKWAGSYFKFTRKQLTPNYLESQYHNIHTETNIFAVAAWQGTLPFVDGPITIVKFQWDHAYRDSFGLVERDDTFRWGLIGGSQEKPYMHRSRVNSEGSGTNGEYRPETPKISMVTMTEFPGIPLYTNFRPQMLGISQYEHPLNSSYYRDRTKVPRRLDELTLYPEVFPDKSKTDNYGLTREDTNFGSFAVHQKESAPGKPLGQEVKILENMELVMEMDPEYSKLHKHDIDTFG